MSVDDLDALVRRVDEDRWLASRFAPAPLRRRLVALYALNNEIAHAAEAARQPALGDIRLTWWRDAITEAAAGGRAQLHPTLLAYADAMTPGGFDAAPWLDLVETRRSDLDGARLEGDAVRAYAQGTAGNVLRLALAACGAPSEHLAVEGGVAWGIVRLIASRRLSADEAMLSAAAQAYEKASQAVRKLPPAAFPAMGYLALTPRYIRKRGAPLSLLSRQFTLIAASARGRI